LDTLARDLGIRALSAVDTLVDMERLGEIQTTARWANEAAAAELEPEPEPKPELEPEPAGPAELGPEPEHEASLALLSVKKERGGRFFISTDGVDVNDSMLFTIGLFSLPTPAFYGGEFPTADMLAIVKGTSATIPDLWIPTEVRAALPDGGAAGFEFCFVLSDVGSIVAQHGAALNLVHHAWLFPEAEPGKRTMGDVSLGIFSYPASQVAHAEKRALGFQCLTNTRVSIHPQKGGMCCSPNNARFVVTTPEPETGSVAGLSYFWSVAVVLDGSRACVSLQWLLTTPDSALRSTISEAVEGSETLETLLPSLANTFGEARALVALQLTFGVGSEGQQRWPCCDGVPKQGPAASSAELEELNRGGGKKSRSGGTGGGGKASGGPLTCSSCNETLAPGSFSKAQRGKRERRRCQICVQAQNPKSDRMT
jgi:hypothetical protein